MCIIIIITHWTFNFLNQNEISLPGTIGLFTNYKYVSRWILKIFYSFKGAISITEQIDIKEGFLFPPYRISHFGCKSPEKNGSFYKFLISSMADSVNKLQREDQLG